MKNASAVLSGAACGLLLGVLLLARSTAVTKADLAELRAEFTTHQQNHDVDVASLHREIERLRADLDAKAPTVVDVPTPRIVYREWPHAADRFAQRIGQLEYDRYGQKVVR